VATSTIPETVVVQTDPLIEAVGFLYHLSTVVSLLNDRQSTSTDRCLEEAGRRLFRAAFDRDWGDGGELEKCIKMVQSAHTKQWLSDLSKHATRQGGDDA
jgi:hypothetical protein